MGTNRKQHSSGKIGTAAADKPQEKPTGVFVNSICTSSAQLIGESVRVKLLDPAKTK